MALRALTVPDGPWPGTVQLHSIWPASLALAGLLSSFIMNGNAQRIDENRSIGGRSRLIQAGDKRLDRFLDVLRDFGIVRSLDLNEFVRRAFAGRQLKKFA